MNIQYIWDDLQEVRMSRCSEKEAICHLKKELIRPCWTHSPAHCMYHVLQMRGEILEIRLPCEGEEKG